MAVKFLNRSKTEEAFEDELLIRCVCGCTILSIGTMTVPISKEEQLSAIEINAFMTDTSEGNGDARCMIFSDIEDIASILNLLRGSLNNGCGAVIDGTGRVLVIGHPDNSAGQLPVSKITSEDTLYLLGFENMKKFKRFSRNPLKNGSLVGWNVIIEPEMKMKFVEACEKIISKKFKEELYSEEMDANEKTTVE